MPGAPAIAILSPQEILERVRQVAPHLRLATLVRISNVWLFEDEGRRWLVDTGHPVERLTLLASLWRAGVRRKGDLEGILLTHRHSDHAGNAAWLRARFACTIACHERDAQVLSGRRAPPPMSGRKRTPLLHEILCRIEDRFPARAPVDEVYTEGPWRSGLQVVPVPGHTDGSVMLYHEPTRTLFSGDAILSGIPPLRLFEWVRPAVDGFSCDVGTCHGSVKRFLEALPPTDVFCSGHGPPVGREAHRKLLDLARRLG